MNRTEKEQAVRKLKSNFENNQSSFIIEVQGLTVEQLQQLRRALRAESSSLKVAKNTLLRRAISSSPLVDSLSPYFKNQVAVVFSDEPPKAAKVLKEIAKKEDKLKLIAGSLENNLLTSEQINFLALLPSREVLLAQVAGTLKAPISAYVNVLNQLILRLLWVLKSISEKK